MDAILNCRMEDVEDYYELLGCDELSTVDQILAEFKIRALECHPDKNPEDPQAVENFQKLQKAKDILTNEESRDRYDYWRRSKVPITFHQWEALSNSVKMSMHWAVRSKKEKMLEEPGPADANNLTDEEGSQQKITKKGLSSTTERKEQGEPETLDKSWSPRSPDSSRQIWRMMEFCGSLC
ncbi:dnaJ homolog subfamily C member 12 isoform X2 [Vombatus ursinus]|uniref:DnaJ homolog subfamily C member 12 n=1 Tax=Vombatus ursinus TaxID=29139 RepID=A0A4X2LEZ4_VOMUR|nr:dnaJ homolog subfamily C member 12 isoform X2 [Vombatus ursinus]